MFRTAAPVSDHVTLTQQQRVTPPPRRTGEHLSPSPTFVVPET